MSNESLRIDALEARLAALELRVASAGAPRAAVSPGGPPAPGTFRFGRTAGQPLQGAPPKDLEWYEGALQQSISDPNKARFCAANVRHLAEVHAAMGRPAQVDAFAADADIPF